MAIEQQSQPVSPYERAWIMHLEQVLPQRVWDSLPDLPPPVFARIPPNRWPQELRAILAPYIDSGAGDCRGSA